MRFLLVDRILRLEPGKEAVVLKSVSQNEDYFADHFPGRPIMPGCLIVESCDQASRILLGKSADFAQLPVLERVVNGKFRRFVRPGDSLRVHVAVVSRAAASVEVRATASVEESTVAQVSLGYRMVDAAEDPRMARVCARMREFFEILTADPLVGDGGVHAGTAGHNSREDTSA
jgi:3-hydroxyacyl-[acyl-carrier-protein] dehydratase